MNCLDLVTRSVWTPGGRTRDHVLCGRASLFNIPCADRMTATEKR